MFRSFHEIPGCGYKDLTSFIKIVENTLSDDDVAQFLDLLDFQPNKSKNHATVGSSQERVSAIRDAYFMLMPLCADGIINNLKDKVAELVNSYIKEQNFCLSEGVTLEAEPSFVCYENQQGYIPHVDARSLESSERLVTAIVYFNDNYSGGELFFPELNYYIAPPKNSTVIFPSSRLFLHGARKVYGRKMISPFWFGYQKREKFIFPWEVA